MRASTSLLSALLLSSALAGCSSSEITEDDSMYLTGTEEYAVIFANGQVGCTNPKKVLICHIPPGNPGNAHDICVSEHAVEPHQSQHGDGIGACDGGTPPPPPPDVDAGGGGTPDASTEPEPVP